MKLDKREFDFFLQIVANPGCDHLTIAVAQEIERTFGGWKEPAQLKNSTPSGEETPVSL